MHRSSTVYKPKQFLTNIWVDFDVRGQQELDFFHWRKCYCGLWTDRSDSLKIKCLDVFLY